jgi:hypothetical protein
MAVAAGTQFTAYLADPGGRTAGVGARIEVPVTRQIVSAWVAGTLDNTGMWSAVLDAPAQAGDYLIVWTTNQPTDPPPFPIFVPVTATLGPVAPTVGGQPDYPNVQASDVMPTVDDVAILERTRTRAEDGTFYPTFNTNTFPSATDVQSVIEKATGMILSQLRADFNPTFYSQVSDLISLQAAVLIEASFFRNQDQAQATSSWRMMISSGLTGLAAQIEVDRAQAVVFAGMEPRQPDWDTDPWLIRVMM